MESNPAILDRKTLASSSIPAPFLRRQARNLLARKARSVPESELQRSAIVISPHPDDESLGCGGTILRKKRAGASVKLVHVSDGGASTTLIPGAELTAMRKRECVNAGRVLGVDDIYFLDFPDGRLWDHIPAMRQRIVQILLEESPDEVFVPYFREPMRQAADHVAVTKAVLGALEELPKPVRVWEYPVWFWLSWPWVGLRQKVPPIRTKHIVKNTVLTGFGARALLELASFVEIGGVLEQKRAAIAEHRSQTEQLIDDPRWVTLEQLSNGELMDCFYQEIELFRCYTYGGTHGAARPHF